MDRQTIFNTVVAGLAAQNFEQSLRGENATNGFGDCAYRGVYGKKCAAGHLLLDEDYHPTMEGGAVCADFIKSKFTKQGISEGDVKVFGFIWQLQNAHDMARKPEAMKARLLQIGLKYDLTIPEGLQ